MMNEADWELIAAQAKAFNERLRAQDERLKAVEARCASLERRLRDRNPEAEVFGERFVLHIPDPDPLPLCPRREKGHSPELPCAPADDWSRFGDEVTGVGV